MDTCEMCGTCADCGISDGWALCEECEGKCDRLDVSDLSRLPGGAGGLCDDENGTGGAIWIVH